MGDYDIGGVASSIFGDGGIEGDMSQLPGLGANALTADPLAGAGIGTGGEPGSVGTNFIPSGMNRGDGGSSWADYFKNFGGDKGVIGGIGDVAKAALPFAQVGGAVMGGVSSAKAASQLAERNKLEKEALGLQEQAAKPLTDFGKTELANATAGKVPEAVEAQIQTWKQGALQQVRDLFARMGIPEGTSETSAENLVEQQATAMRAQYLQQEKTTGVGALEGAAGAASGMGAQAGQQDATLQGLIQNANQMLSRLGGAAA